MIRWTTTLTILLSSGALGRAATAQVVDSARAAAPIAVFLDCRTSCDDDLARTEITYVDWVRDRAVADVHLLITGEEAGAGGRAVTLAFIGQGRMAGRGDTLGVTLDPTTTEDEQRREIVRTMALGLVRFVAHTPAARLLRVTALAPERERPIAQRRRDRWNAWVFEVGLGGSTERERLFTSNSLSTDFSARRVTDQWKTELELDLRYDDDRATVESYDDAGNVVGQETFTNLQRNWELSSLVVRSVSPHWSLGVRAGIESDTYRNQRQSIRLTPAIEYNVFPYSQSTRRELTVQYGAGYDVFKYREVTIFDRLQETLPVHYVEVRYRTRQPWGSTDLSAEHRNYITDASKRNTEINGSLDVRIARGLSVELGGGYEWIRDQLYLEKGQENTADVLLRRRALLTGFQSHLFVGLSYTFGSIYNNVVNSRF